MSKRALLNEEVTRRMMKLANIGAVNAQNFITEAYEDPEEANAQAVSEEEELEEANELEEDKAYTAKKEKPGEDIRKGAEKRGAEGTLAKTPGHGKVDYVKEGEDVYQEEESEEEAELHATEDELGAEDELAGEEGAELDALDVGLEEPVEAEGGKEEKFKEVVDLLADLLDIDADVELDGDDEVDAEEEVALDTPEGDIEVDAEEELMEALVRRVAARIEETKQRKAQKEQIAESVADRIMKRLES